VADKEVFLATITAYTSSPDETDDTPFITASGETTRRGIVACPSRYAFGTVVLVEGVQYECQDRMNRRYREKDHFDIWVESKSEAFEWGKKQAEIVVFASEM
jgi:3D (Asp-Asp-Asp) domain-containing protein